MNKAEVCEDTNRSVSRFRLLLSELGLLLFIWVASIAIGFFDFFAVSDSLRSISQEAFYTVAADAILHEPAPSLTVVLANDSDLADLDTSWPLSTGFQAEIISEILALEPRALFVDFLFLDLHDEDAMDALIEAVSNAPPATRIVFASPSANTDWPLSSEARRIEARLVAAGAILANAGRVASEGEIVVMPIAGEPPSVSLVLRDSYCASDDVKCAALSDRNAPTEIVWRAKPHDCNGTNPPDICASIPLAWPLRLIGLVWGNLFPRLEGQDALARKGLLPYPVYGAASVILGEADPADINGKVVFYGASFRAASDHAPSVVYGDVPGVFVHATHFDNLVTLGDRRFTSALPLGLPKLAYEALLAALLASIMFAVRVFLRWDARRTFASKHVAKISGVVVTCLSIVLVTGEATVLRTTPEHWLLAPQLIFLSQAGTYWGVARSARRMAARIRAGLSDHPGHSFN